MQINNEQLKCRKTVSHFASSDCGFKLHTNFSDSWTKIEKARREVMKLVKKTI